MAPLLPHLPYVIFVVLLGACVGSFLNVVVYRLPRVELPPGCSLPREAWLTLHGLSDPPSHCPKCNRRLRWYDNLPVVGWVKLGGRCRYCREPISVRYPIVEAATAVLFGGYYIAYYVLQWRSCCPVPLLATPGWQVDTSWPIFGLYAATLSVLLASSLIDVELYVIPQILPWTLAAVALVVHGVFDRTYLPGTLNLVGDYGPAACAVAAGGGVGLLVSLALRSLGVLPVSFPDCEPLLDVDREAILAERAAARAAGEPLPDDGDPLPPPMAFRDVRREMYKEAAFLLPPVAAAAASVGLFVGSPRAAAAWAAVAGQPHVTGLLGSVLGGLVGAAVPWVVRIAFTFVFRRVAMGLGDAHLMFGVGAVIGGGGATAAFLLAPFAGMAVWVVQALLRRGRRELPFGPYLSLATAVVMLSYCPIAGYFRPAVIGLSEAATLWWKGGGT